VDFGGDGDHASREVAERFRSDGSVKLPQLIVSLPGSRTSADIAVERFAGVILPL
jgi:hypothetical protein